MVIEKKNNLRVYGCTIQKVQPSRDKDKSWFKIV